MYGIKLPTFAALMFDADPQILCNLYQKDSDFLADVVCLLHGVGDDRGVLLLF